MGISSFRLVSVGGGYWRVLGGLWLNHMFGIGPYRELTRQTPREKPTVEIASDHATAR